MTKNKNSTKRKILSLSMPQYLYESLEEARESLKIENRSQFYNNLLIHSLQHYYTQELEQSIKTDDEKLYLGMIAFIYKHDEQSDTQAQLTNLQHKLSFHSSDRMKLDIMFNTHIHVNNEQCLELIICKSTHYAIYRLRNDASKIEGIISVFYRILQTIQN